MIRTYMVFWNIAGGRQSATVTDLKRAIQIADEHAESYIVIAEGSYTKELDGLDVRIYASDDGK